MTSSPVLDDLRDAAALGRLIVVTGAGISRDLKRATPSKLGSSTLLNWGDLVKALYGKANLKLITPEKRSLLEDLLPAGLLAEVHGDALIEASEIIAEGFKGDKFNEAIAALCREADGQTSENHRAIVELAPAGLITFNYDRAHECAFGNPEAYSTIIYDEDERLRAALSKPGHRPFLLKAHGCIDRPSSLVLTSTSYRQVLSRRLYRAFLQHALIHYSVLIVGFGMRDRDFDQLLHTLELEVGAPVQRQAFITSRPDKSPKGLIKAAEWAMIRARFGVEPIYIDNYAESPAKIRSIANTPGPLVHDIVDAAASSDSRARSQSHRRMTELGPIGRHQVRTALIAKLDASEVDLIHRSELIYGLGSVADGAVDVAERMVTELRDATLLFPLQPLPATECAAHALLVLRRSRIDDPEHRAQLRDRIMGSGLDKIFRQMDKWLISEGGVPRIEAYAKAALAEIESRGRR